MTRRQAKWWKSQHHPPPPDRGDCGDHARRVASPPEVTVLQTGDSIHRHIADTSLRDLQLRLQLGSRIIYFSEFGAISLQRPHRSTGLTDAGCPQQQQATTLFLCHHKGSQVIFSDLTMSSFIVISCDMPSEC